MDLKTNISVSGLDIDDIAKAKFIMNMQNSFLKIIAELVEFRDCETGYHIERTERYLGALFGAMLKKGIYAKETDEWDLLVVLTSAQLHDVGKISVPDHILRKPGALTTEEFEIIKKHTIVGEAIIDKIGRRIENKAFLEHARVFAGTHHEKWDGSGYPNGLKGENIPLQGRMMAIADVYDALISERPYKNMFTHKQAVDIIKEGYGTHFDPILVDVFLGVSEDFDKIAKELREKN